MQNALRKIDGCVLSSILESALRIRCNDELIRESARSGRLNIIYYSPRGQEIIPSAISELLTDDDYICTIYRGIHDQIAKGVPPKLIWAEYAGRLTGSCKGKGGPMHITYPEKGVMVTTGIVGSSLPIANGLALASQLRGDGRVTVAYFGDGASNIGAFHESLNMASVWKLPVIFVCQNNRYAEHSRFDEFTAGESVARRGDAYGMHAVAVDGNDAEATWHTARAAIDRARSGDGPTLIEANTFRFEGHLLGDDSAYIPRQEMEAAKAADPVPRLRADVIGRGILTEAQVVELERKIRREVEEAREFALTSDWPSLDELSCDVLANSGEVVQ